MTSVPLHRARVRAAASELCALRDRLLAAGPVSAGGIARMRALLSDDAGPLYYDGGPDDLRTRVCAAIAALETIPDSSAGGGPAP